MTVIHLPEGIKMIHNIFMVRILGFLQLIFSKQPIYLMEANYNLV